MEVLDEFEEDPDSSDEHSDCEEDEGDNDGAVAMERAPKDKILLCLVRPCSSSKPPQPQLVFQINVVSLDALPKNKSSHFCFH